MGKRQAGQGNKRKRSTQRVGQKRASVNQFETLLAGEFRQARKRLSAAGFERWALNQTAQFMAVAVSAIHRNVERRR